jgi:predicted phosphodiesterase
MSAGTTDTDGLYGGFFPVVPWPVRILPVPEPSRVAFAGCWHHESGLIRSAMHAASAGGATMLVHTGDFLMTSPWAEQLVLAVEEEAAALDLMVLVVRGNHDDPAIFARAVTATSPSPDGFARLAPHVLHAPHGLRWTWQGLTFAALGGAHSVDRTQRRDGTTWWPEEVATGEEVARTIAGGPVDVLVTHDVPSGTPIPWPATPPDWWDLVGAEAYRQVLRDVVEATRPRWVLSGHLHLRHSDDLYLPGGHRTHVEVLDSIEHGVHGNVLLADLTPTGLTFLAPTS